MRITITTKKNLYYHVRFVGMYEHIRVYNAFHTQRTLSIVPVNTKIGHYQFEGTQAWIAHSFLDAICYKPCIIHHAQKCLDFQQEMNQTTTTKIKKETKKSRAKNQLPCCVLFFFQKK